MRKFLVGAILGALVADNAGASIISRSFLDQALTDYATNTALDLKANQSDFTDLNTQISDSVILLRELWNEDSYWFLYATNPEYYSENIIGAFSLLETYLVRLTYGLVRGWADTDGTSYMGLVELNNGWTDSEGNTYLGVKGLNDKIGTLPSGEINIGTQGLNEMFGKEKSFPVTIPSDYTLSDAFQNLFYSGGVFPSFVDIAAYTMFGGTLSSYWESVHGIKTYKGLLELTKDIGTLPSGDMLPSRGLAVLLPDPEYYTYPTSIGDFMGQMYGGYLGVSGLAEAVYHGNAFMGQTDTTLQVKGLRQITDEIGTLPSGSLLNQTRFTDELYRFTQGTESPVYPNSMAELVKQIYGEFSSSVIQPGLVHLLITGFLHNGSLPVNSDEIGILPAISLAETANSVANTARETANAAKFTADANTAKIGTVPDGKNLVGMISETDAKIGTLPSGNFPIIPGSELLFPVSAQSFRYPTSLAELITAIYGNSETGVGGLLGAIIAGFPVDRDGDGQFDLSAGLLPNLDLATEAKELATTANTTATAAKTAADANTAKIGDLPTEYATVGAALTAMDAKIDARELPSTSDDGQYVLSAKKVGDTITYTWVKMDLTSEEQAQ